MSAALQHPIGPHTVEEWLALPPSEDGSRTELILGHYHVSPAASGRHQLAAGRLIRPLEDCLYAAGRTDLYVVPAVNVEISTAWRTALIPDLVILGGGPDGIVFPATSVVLAVEIWSPGNTQTERETKILGYAAAGVPFLWTIDQRNRTHGPRLLACRLQHGRYTVENSVEVTGPVTVTAAPVPITLDLAALGL